MFQRLRSRLSTATDLPPREWSLAQFEEWLSSHDPSPSMVRRALRRVRSGVEEDADLLAASMLRRFDTHLVRGLIRRTGGDAALALARNDALREPALVRAVLDECAAIARAFSMYAPFGLAEWPSFQAVLHLVERGRVTFRYSRFRKVRRVFVRYPELGWARPLVLADPRTPAAAIETVWRKRLSRADIPRLLEARIDVLEALLLRNTSPDQTTERWDLLVQLSPERGARAAALPHVRHRIALDDLVALLHHESRDVRLHAMLAVSEVQRAQRTAQGSEQSRFIPQRGH